MRPINQSTYLIPLPSFPYIAFSLQLIDLPIEEEQLAIHPRKSPEPLIAFGQELRDWNPSFRDAVHEGVEEGVLIYVVGFHCGWWWRMRRLKGRGEEESLRVSI